MKFYALFSNGMDAVKRFNFLFFCFLFLLSTLPASQWDDLSILSVEGKNAMSPKIAIDSFGHAVAVWARFDGNHMVIQASVKPLGKSWQEIPDNLSLGDHDAFNPQVAVDFFGNATVVWEKFNGSNTVIQASTKPFGRRWQFKPDQISQSGKNSSLPQITTDLLGKAVIIWQCQEGEESVIQASSKLPGKGWDANPSTLSPRGWKASHPQLVIDECGNPTAVWQASRGGKEVIQALAGFPQGGWDFPLETLCLGSLCNSDPQIAVDAFGNLTAVWNQFDGSHGTIQTCSKPCGGNWQAIPDVISLPGRNSFSPQLAVESNGDVTVVWEEFNDRKLKCIQASTKSFADDKWQPIPTTLSPPGDHNVNPQIAVDESKGMIVVWNNYKGFTRIYSSMKPLGGDWQLDVREISPRGFSAFNPQVAVDLIGGGQVIWVTQGGLSFIQAAEFAF